ncbi:hypothetical protein MHH81_21020 [Psychrobacillus sp. FSL H8-0484]|uniref:hypothetical protein n=1 Tax=Psychrobacillus sp. FSL H8-0484 TaxID=2921390 RepID=UPI0030F68312
MITVARNDEGSFVWHHLHEAHGRLGIVSKTAQSQIFSQLQSNMRELEERVFTITTKPRPNQEGEIDKLSILEMEKYPSPEDDPTGYADVRSRWVQEYFNLLCHLYNKERLDFIPLARYRPHVEGPLLGYVRSIDSLEDAEQKKVLFKHLEKLENVDWVLSENGDLTYYVTGTTEKERLESFYIAAWSYWSFTAFIQEPIPINLFIDLDEWLVAFPVQNEKRDYINYIMNNLSNLTFNLCMSLTVKSATLYPLPESKVEHVLYETNEVEDLDLSGVELFNASVSTDQVIWENTGIYRKMKLLLANQ